MENDEVLPQDLCPNKFRSTVKALCREQFLYSLSRTPSPARFRQRCHDRRILTCLRSPLRANDIACGTSRHHGTTEGTGDSSHIEGSNTETQRNISVGQMAQSRNEEKYRLQYLAASDVVDNSQGSYPEEYMRCGSQPTHISNQIGVNSANIDLDKSSPEISASDISTSMCALPLMASMSSSASSSEYNIQCDISDESRYHSDVLLVQELDSFDISNKVSRWAKGGSSLATTHSTGLSCVNPDAHSRQPLSSQRAGFPAAGDNVNNAPAGQILHDPGNRRNERVSVSSPEVFPQNAASAIDKMTIKKLSPELNSHLFGESEVEWKVRIPKDISESKEMQLDKTSRAESQLTVTETPRLNIYRRRCPENSHLGLCKKPRKGHSKTKRKVFQSNLPHFKPLDRPQAKGYPKRMLTRDDFCDGFVGQESQPTGRTMVVSRPRRLLNRVAVKRSTGYVRQLSLVRFRSFDREFYTQKDSLGPVRDHSHKTNRLAMTSNRRIVLTEEHHALTSENPRLDTSIDIEHVSPLSDEGNTYYRQRLSKNKESGKAKLRGKSEDITRDEKNGVDPTFHHDCDIDDLGNSQQEEQRRTRDTEGHGEVFDKANLQQIKAHPTTSYKFASSLECINFDTVQPHLSNHVERASNCSIKPDLPLPDNSPLAKTLKRCVTFNEDVEVILQQLAMVSAPAPTSEMSSDDESEYGHTDDEGDDTLSEKSDNDPSSSGNSSDTDDHSFESPSPRHNRRLLDSNPPSTPIHRRARMEDSESLVAIIGTRMLEQHKRLAQDEEMILDDSTNIIFEEYHNLDLLPLHKRNYNNTRLEQSLDYPWGPKDLVLDHRGGNGDGVVSESRSFSESNMDIEGEMNPSQYQEGLDSSQHSTSISRHKKRRRKLSIELGNDNCPSRSIYSSSIPNSQPPITTELENQAKNFVVSDVPTYFPAASLNLNLPHCKVTLRSMRSKSMPSLSRNLEKKAISGMTMQISL